MLNFLFQGYAYFFKKNKDFRDFLGGPVTKTVFPMLGPEFDPWTGNQIPYATAKSLYAAMKT